MNIKITDRNGVTLKTANTFVKEDIAISLDESMLGSGESAKITVTYNGGTPIPNTGTY